MMFIGLGTTIGSLDYNIGTLVRMGPGFFPMMLGVLLMLVAGLMIATPVAAEDQQESPDFRKQIRPWLMVVLGVAVFIVIGQYGGLVPAAFSMILISALGDRNNSLIDGLILAACVTAVAVGIFHYGMQMQFPLFRWG